MKKVLIWLGIIAGLLIAYGALNFFYLTRLASPKEVVTFEDGEFRASIEYCRPSKKGRIIFGEEKDGALQPYGVYWRLGANKATELELSKSISIKNEVLPKGKYRLYAIPGKEQWDIVFNSELGQWGYQEANHEMDVLTVRLPVEELQEEVEMFTITLLKDQETAVPMMNFFWDRTLIRLPFSYE